MQAIEDWADRVEPDDLVVADTEALRLIAELAERRSELDGGLDVSEMYQSDEHRAVSALPGRLNPSGHHPS